MNFYAGFIQLEKFIVMNNIIEITIKYIIVHLITRDNNSHVLPAGSKPPAVHKIKTK